MAQTKKKKKTEVSKTVAKAEELNGLVLSLKISKKEIKKEIPSEIISAIKMVGHIQALESELSVAKEALKATIKNIMKNVKLAEILADEFKANYTKYESSSFDSKLFQQEHAKMYAKYVFPKEKTRFSVDANKKG